MWDLVKSGKQKWSLFGASDGQNHSRIVFNMSSVELQDRELLISTSMDREVGRVRTIRANSDQGFCFLLLLMCKTMFFFERLF